MVEVSGGDDVLDSTAINDYKETYADLCAELEVAKRNNDAGNIEKLKRDIDDFGRQITCATGLGGRKRKLGDEREKARKSVTNAINRAIGSIQRHDANLANHLQNSIRMGQSLCYSPDPDVDWDM
jgi:hypothetical protein